MQVDRIMIDRPMSEWQWLLIQSDMHIGAANTDIPRIKADLDLARERNARVIMIGDVFDMILPKDSKRFKPSAIAPWLRDRDDQVSCAVEYATELFAPYADMIDIIGMGNHEESVVKYHATNPIALLVSALNSNAENGHRVIRGAYTGYLQYLWCKPGSKFRRPYNVLYNHGSGGTSPVSKGMIDVARKRTNWVYHLYVFGHKHHCWAAADVTVSLSGRGNVQISETRDVQTGTYLRYYGGVGDTTYEMMSSAPPRPLGGSFVRFRWAGNSANQLCQRVEV